MIITTPFKTFYLDITEKDAERQIEQVLLRDGIITFDTISSTKELLHLCQRLGTIVKHRDADETGITRIVKRTTEQPISSYQAFTNSHLTLHTDGSSIPDPANTLADGTISIRFRYDNLGYYAPSVCNVLPIFLDLLDRHKISLTLQKHQGYIIQNGRWLHGRTAFRGEREVYRILVRPGPETYVGIHVGMGFRPDP